MKRIAFVAWLFFFAAYAQDRRLPVIVELFTSEGCSSCPNADALLARLEHSQPVPGVRIIALEEHVDYWNQLGWTDPFSAPQYRARQNDYALAFHTDNIFTPQMVVSGRTGFVGDDSDRAVQEIQRATQLQNTFVGVSATPGHDLDLVDLTVHVSRLRGAKTHDAQVFLAVTENELSTPVYRGENTGKTLRHSAVVRSFGAIGRMDARGSNEGRLTSKLRLPRDWRRENLRAVVFVQERDTFRITGAGTAELR